MVELLDGGSKRARVIDLLRSHRAHIYIHGIGHMMCAQTMFGRVWHTLSTVRSQALTGRIEEFLKAENLF